MVLTVRPFEQIIERFDHPLAIRVEGFIRSGTFSVSFDNITRDLPTARIGNDRFGEFAEVEETIIELPDGFLIKVEPGYPEPGDSISDPGCQICLFRSSDPEMYERIIKDKGYDPSMVIPLIPPETSISVYFNSAGILNGFGCLSKIPYVEWNAPKPRTVIH